MLVIHGCRAPSTGVIVPDDHPRSQARPLFIDGCRILPAGHGGNSAFDLSNLPSPKRSERPEPLHVAIPLRHILGNAVDDMHGKRHDYTPRRD